MEKTLKDYAVHLHYCNLNQDWGDAFDAMVHTPNSLRDEAYEKAYSELMTKSLTCSCGLEQLLASQPSQQKPPEPKPTCPTCGSDNYRIVRNFCSDSFHLPEPLNVKGATAESIDRFIYDRFTKEYRDQVSFEFYLANFAKQDDFVKRIAQEYSLLQRNKAIQECIDECNNLYKDAVFLMADSFMKSLNARLEKLKR